MDSRNGAQQRYERARKRVEALKGFYGHLQDYIMVNLVLIAGRNYRRWEKDLRNYINARKKGEPVSEKLQLKARRKILDQPFVVAGLSGINWLLDAVIFLVHQLIRAQPDQPPAGLFWECASVFIGIGIARHVNADAAIDVFSTVQWHENPVPVVAVHRGILVFWNADDVDLVGLVAGTRVGVLSHCVDAEKPDGNRNDRNRNDPSHKTSPHGLAKKLTFPSLVADARNVRDKEFPTRTMRHNYT